MYKKMLSGVALVMVLSGTSFAGMKTTAKQAYIYDTSTGTVLLSKESENKMYPASMTKMMTVYIIFEQLKSGILSLDDKFLVSKKAWKKGGSKMFVGLNSRISISDLLRGVIVQSGNDAAIVLAEGVSGSESSFALLMTAKAKELGMTQTNFLNSTGWPDENHYTSPKDLSILAIAMIKNFPEYYPIWAEKSFKYAGIKQYNRNPLLNKKVGADGLKTGHTKAAGYGLTGTFKIGERRLIMVLNGMKSKKERISESVRLARSALYDYKAVTLLSAGTVFENAPVVMANVSSIPLIVKDTLKYTIKTSDINAIKTKLEYLTPLKAPINKGDIVGRVTMNVPNMKEISIPLYAGMSVKRPSIFTRIRNNFNYIVWGEM